MQSLTHVEKSVDVASILKTIAHPTRIAIIGLLKQNRRLSVNEICEMLALDQSLISHHLSCMKRFEILQSVRDGRNIYYSMMSESVVNALNCFKNNEPRMDGSTEEMVEKVLMKSSIELALIQEIVAVGRYKKVKIDEIIISPESVGNEIPIVLEGSLKVLRRDADGHEVFLYYLNYGETCAMSVACCLDHQKTAFHVLAEEDSILWMIPVNYLDEWIEKYRSFRQFIFKSYQGRFDELLTTIDNVVFLNLDDRLYNYLLDKKQSSGSYVIHKTHQQIATELNSSRVVISRLLKKLEKEGKIEQFRNRIEIQ